MTYKRKILITSVIFGIISLAFIIFIIYPMFSEIKKNSGRLVSQKKELNLLRTKIEDLRKFEKIYEIREKDLEKIDDVFANPDVPINFINFLEKTAEDSHVLIKVSPAVLKKSEKDPWSSINFQLNLTGSFSNLSKFLDKLKNSPWLIEVLNLNVRKLTEKEIRTKKIEEISLEDISANLLIKVYAR